MGPLFEHPGYAPWLVAVLGLLGLGVALARRRELGRLRMLFGGRRASRPPASARPALHDAVSLLALGAIAVALLGPRIGVQSLVTTRAGGDVVLLLDVSASMRARDVPPSRLERARRIAADLLADLPRADRVALAGFAGRGVLFTPLTHDHDALAQMLPAIDTRLVQPAGSNLEAGLASALEAFEPDAARPRTIVLLSDGERTGEADFDAEVRSARAQVRVVSVALGTAPGATIPDSGAPLRDHAGRVVTSRRQTLHLETLARATHGALLLADSWGELPPGALVREVARDPWAAAAPDGSTSRVRTIPSEAPGPFAAAAFGLLVIELLLGARRHATLIGRRPIAESRRRRIRAAGAAALALSVLGADARFDAATRRLEQGWRAARADQPQRATRAFRAVTREGAAPRLAAIAEHNLGVLALAGGALAPAHDHFAASLARHVEAEATCAPSTVAEACAYTERDRARAGESRFNLEWTQRKLEGMPAPESMRGPARERPPGDEADTNERRDPPGGEVDTKNQAVAGRPAAMTEAERRAWMARVGDDPSAALRRAVHHASEAGGPRHRGAPW